MDEVPLKMLIDIIYRLKYNHQIFGSQGATIKLADEIVRNEVMNKYNLK